MKPRIEDIPAQFIIDGTGKKTGVILVLKVVQSVGLL